MTERERLRPAGIFQALGAPEPCLGDWWRPRPHSNAAAVWLASHETAGDECLSPWPLSDGDGSPWIVVKLCCSLTVRLQRLAKLKA